MLLHRSEVQRDLCKPQIKIHVSPTQNYHFLTKISLSCRTLCFLLSCLCPCLLPLYLAPASAGLPWLWVNTTPLGHAFIVSPSDSRQKRCPLPSGEEGTWCLLEKLSALKQVRAVIPSHLELWQWGAGKHSPQAPQAKMVRLCGVCWFAVSVFPPLPVSTPRTRHCVTDCRADL